MIQEFEVFQLLLGSGALLFVLRNRPYLRQLPAPHLLLLAFSCALASWTLSVAEGFLWEETLNLLQHACTAVGAIFLATWCWQVSSPT